MEKSLLESNLLLMHLISLYQNKRQKNAFNTFKNSKWNSLWFFNYLLFTRLSLLLLGRWQFFCLYWPFLWQKYISHFYFTPSIFRTQTRSEWATIFVCKKLYCGRNVYLYYKIYLVCMFCVFHKKLCLSLTNRPDSLKHMQYFDAHNSN